MKRLVSFIVIFVILIGIGIYYYTNLDNNYHSVQELYNFPIPNDAKLESEDQKGKNYIWDPSTGTKVPISYSLTIKKNGWKKVKMDGHNVIYKKDGKYINLTLAPDSIGIIKDSK